MYIENLYKAKRYYDDKGFNVHEVPWLIEEEYIRVTLPKGKNIFKVQPTDLCLLGSAEQSFIKFMCEMDIENYRIQAITPCFRDECFVSETTRLYFMKLELCHINPNNADESLQDIIDVSLGFYREVIELPVSLVKTSEGFDIYYEDLELGSYGIRTYKDNTWVYGTGVAEPRCTIAQKRHSLCV